MDSLKKDKNLRPKKIEATPEYMHKLFIMPNSPDKFVEFGEHLLDMIHDFYQEKGGIHSSVTLDDLSRIFNNTQMPKSPMLIKDLLDEIKNNIIKHSVKVANPFYIGHMTTSIPYFMILLEMISVSLNQNQVKIESAKASSFVEREFLCWMHSLVFQKSRQFYEKNIQNHRITLGNITSDGTIANLTAYMLAIAKAFPPDGSSFEGIRKEGITRALEHYGYRQAVILVSKRGHYSICKSGTVLGIGEKGVVFSPVHPYTNKIDIDKLQQTIEKIKKEDKLKGRPSKIVALTGIAGTTETGNIDDLVKLSQIAGELGTHYHIDAAWGGGALMMNGGKELLKGIEKADTVSFDAHKL
jgi:glutamate decarboxylase